jgi:hypothetical protein
MTITMAIETITPEIAQQILDANTHNRLIKPNNMKKIIADLEAGRWHLNGEAIKIAKDNTLLDGQHRLLAVIATNKNITTCVVRGLNLEDQDTMDTGSPRTVRDALSIDKMPNSSNVATIANNLVRLRYTHKLSEFRFMSVSNIEVREFISDHYDNIAASARVAAATNGNPLQKSVVGTVHYLAHYVLGLGEEYDQFTNVMKTGIPTYDGDPAYHLREKIIRHRMTKTVYRPGDLIAMTLGTFEHFAKRNPCTKIYPKDTIEFTGFDPKKL